MAAIVPGARPWDVPEVTAAAGVIPCVWPGIKAIGDGAAAVALGLETEGLDVLAEKSSLTET